MIYLTSIGRSLIMNIDYNEIYQLEQQLETALNKLSDLCYEVPSLNRNIEILKADLDIFKHSMMVD